MTVLRIGDVEVQFEATLVLRDGREVAMAAEAPSSSGAATVHAFSADGMRLELQASAEDGGWRIEPALTGPADMLAQIDRIVLFDADISAFGFDRVYSARREIWLPTGLRTGDAGRLPDGPPLRRPDRPVIQDTAYDFAADNLIALYRSADGDDGASLLAGVVYPGRHGLEMMYERGRLRIWHRIESPLAQPGRVAIDAFLLRWGRPLVEALADYGQRNRVTVRRSQERAAVTAWNTWDYFQAHLGQEDVVRCAEWIASHPRLGQRINAIVLDDGWAMRGDWQPNARFGDLAGMAAALRRLGFIPGIWYSPFRVDPGCQWVKDHPDTVLWGEPRGHYTKPLTEASNARVLDYSHPLVVQKVFDDLRRLRAMGFRYFKTDFLQAPNSNFVRPKLADPGCSPTEGVRRVMHAIRAAIGYDSFWLACGTEFLPVAGLADAARISDDITLHFSTVQVAVRHCAMYFWANGNLWLTDPDFLVARGPQTSHSPHLSQAEALGHPRRSQPYERVVLHSGPMFTVEEARTWTNFHIVYGGVCAWSDLPGALNEHGQAMIEKALEWHEPSGAGVPLDLATRNCPSRWLRPARGGRLLGLFNFDDQPATIALTKRDLAQLAGVRCAVDIWSGREEPWDGKSFAVALPAHHSRVFHLRQE